MPELTIPNITPQVDSLNQTLSNPLQKVVKDIRRKEETKVRGAEDYLQEQQSMQSIQNQVFGDKKIDLTRSVAAEDIYTNIGGDLIPTYQNFLYGSDNNERLAQTQSTGDKWANGLSKAGINTLTTVAGSTIGSITGVINWVSNGFDTEALYTDDFNQWLDEVNRINQYKLPNYYTRQEQDNNLWESLSTANFWANDVAGGISFTLGAIVGESIWSVATGGAGLATSMARLGLKGTKAARAVKALNYWDDLGKGILRKGYKKSTVKALGRAGEIVNTSRFIYTSAGYEAGVEARGLMFEARESFLSNFKELNGRAPTAEERKAFEENLTSAANSSYVANLALVGASNLAIFGKMFKVTNPLFRSGKALKQGVNRSLFGIGTETTTEGAKFARTVLKPTRLQKVAGYTTSIAKAPIIEGLWEEGQQSVVRNTANNWLESGYDLESTKNSYGLIEAMYDGYADTYGSKEGWKEIGIGMIVGLFGGGVSGSFTSYNRALKGEQQYADAINDKHVGTQILTDKMFAQNQITKANLDEMEAVRRGDKVGEENARRRAILSSVRVHEKYDRLDQSYEDFKTSVELVDSQQVADEQGIDVEDVNAYKEAVIAEYKKIQDTYASNIEFARYIVGSGDATQDLNELELKLMPGETANKQWVAQAIAYNLTMGEGSSEVASILMDDIKTELETIVSPTQASKFKNALGVREALEKASEKKRKTFFALKGQRTKLQNQKEALEKQITDSQQVLERMDDSQSKQNIQTKLIDLANKLNDINERIRIADNEQQLAFQTLKLTNPFGTNTEILTAEQLDEALEITDGRITGGTLAQIDEIVDALSETDPKKYERFKKLFHEYQKAVYSFKEFNKTVEGINSENFSPANFQTQLEKIIGKGKNANDFTRDYFANVGNQMAEHFTGETLPEGQQTETTNTATATEEDGDIPNTNEQVAEEQALTPVQRLKNLISEALKKNSLVSYYIGKNLSETAKKQPTQAELDEYLELHNKIESSQNSNKEVIQNSDPETLIREQGSQINLTVEEVQRFQELNTKLSNWQVVEGTMMDSVDSSLADLIVRLQQLQTTPETNDTKKQVTVNDAIKIEQASDKNSSKTIDNKNMVQTPQHGVYMKVTQNSYTISHATVKSLAQYLGGFSRMYYKKPRSKKVIEITSIEQLEKVQKDEGNVFTIVLEDGTEVQTTITDKAALQFSKKQWEDIRDRISLKFFTVEGVDPQTYLLGYEVLEDGNVVPAKSDFTIETDNINKPFFATEQEMKNAKNVKAFVDLENTYNKKLLDNVRKAKTEQDKRVAEEKLREQVVVYLMSGNKIIGTLRGGGMENLGKAESSVNYGLIRNRAAEMLTNPVDENTTMVDLGTTIPVEFVYKGSPVFSVNSDMTLDKLPITEKASRKIKDAGYYQNGQLVTKNGATTENTNTTYLPNSTEKTPIIIFEHEGERIAFPVSLVSGQVDLSGRLETIINRQDLTDGQKVNAINTFLLENGISPSDYNLEERDLQYTNKLNAVAERLQDHTVYPNVENWARSNYNLDNLRTEAEISIDITDRPFNTPKVKLGLETATFGKAFNIKDARNEARDNEVDAATNLYNTIISLSTPHYAPEEFGELWDIISEKGATGNYMRDIQPVREEMLKLAKKFNTKYAKETYGEQTSENIRGLGTTLSQAMSRHKSLQEKVNLNKNLKKEAKEKREESCK